MNENLVVPADADSDGSGAMGGSIGRTGTMVGSACRAVAIVPSRIAIATPRDAGRPTRRMSSVTGGMLTSTPTS